MFVPPARARPQRTMLMSKRKVGEGGDVLLLSGTEIFVCLSTVKTFEGKKGVYFVLVNVYAFFMMCKIVHIP